MKLVLPEMLQAYVDRLSEEYGLTIPTVLKVIVQDHQFSGRPLGAPPVRVSQPQE